MIRIRIPLLLIVLLAAVIAGCGNDNDPPDSDAGASGGLRWSSVDGGSASAGINPSSGGDSPCLAEFSAKLYAAWAEGDHIRVAVYNGNDAAPAWAFIDGGANGINKDPGQTAGHAQLVAFNAKLYAAWSEAGSIRVAVYNGNDAAPVWTFVDGDGVAGIVNDPAATAEHPRFAVLGTKLYATWQELGASTLAQVAVYNGNDSAPDWTFVDNGGIVSTNVGGSTRPVLAAFSSKLYLAFENNGIAVQVYGGDDAAPAWTSVTGALTVLFRINEQAYNPELAVLNGRLYLAWREYLSAPLFSSMQIRVAVYNGNDAAADWRFVDGHGVYGINKNPHLFADSGPRMVVHQARLYAVWSERLPDVEIGQVTVAAYNGTDAAPAWTFADKGEFGINFDPAHNAMDPAVAVVNSKLYAAWRETYAGTQIRVAVGQ